MTFIDQFDISSGFIVTLIILNLNVYNDIMFTVYTLEMSYVQKKKKKKNFKLHKV